MTTATRPLTVGHLTELGQGFRWHIERDAAAGALVDVAREALVDMHAAQTPFPLSALVPESAAALARSLEARVGAGVPVVGFDLDPGLHAVLDASGHAVTALSPQVHATDDVTLGYAIEEPLPEPLVDAHRVAIVDTIGTTGNRVAALARAAACVPVGAHVCVLVHALERAQLRDVVDQLPLETRAEDHELCARLIGDAGLADVLWDAWWLERKEGPLPVSPTNGLPPQRLDPKAGRHGCFELHGLSPTLAPEDVDAALDAVVAAYGAPADARLGRDTDERLMRAVRFADGCHLALLVDRQRHFLGAQIAPWTSAGHVRVVVALATHLDRNLEPIRF